jgi:hypothetical protein
MDGDGIIKYPDNDVYEGKFENNKKNGWGKLIEYNDKGEIVNSFEGNWLNDEPDETSITNPELS